MKKIEAIFKPFKLDEVKEVFRDADGVRTGAGRDLTLGEITLTGSYKFTAKLLGRVEFRQD
jgi:nitrogen regulatory protein PII